MTSLTDEPLLPFVLSIVVMAFSAWEGTSLSGMRQILKAGARKDYVGTRNARREFSFLLILPLSVAIAFLLIADIDSPRQGMIRVAPENPVSLSQALRAPR